jgi:hypothetical protein
MEECHSGEKPRRYEQDDVPDIHFAIREHDLSSFVPAVFRVEQSIDTMLAIDSQKKIREPEDAG